MSVTIHGELTAAGDRIVLIAGGPIDDVAYAAKQLAHLTPLIKPSEPRGALITARSWPAAVQLSATYGDRFRPGPRLQEWIRAEAATRSAIAGDELSVPLPDGLVPRPYQVDGARLIAATGNALIFDEPRTGKTITTILGLAQLELDRGAVPPILVVCPASVVDPWVIAWNAWAPGWRAVAWRGAPARRHALAGTADVYVTSYETAARDARDTNPNRSPLVALDPRALVVDECFPAGTPVLTPQGEKPIESLLVGDEVIGVDHTTGEPVVTRVKHTFARSTDAPLVSIGTVDSLRDDTSLPVRMTADHPVWAKGRYRPADTVSHLHPVCNIRLCSLRGQLHADVRMVWPTVHQGQQAQQPTTVLQRELLGEVANVETGLRRVLDHRPETPGGIGEHAPVAGASGRGGEAASAPARPDEPAARSGRAGEGTGDVAGSGLPRADRWERAADGTSEAAGGRHGLADGVPDQDGPEAAVPGYLQGRPGVTGTDGRYRDRRRESQEPEGQGARRPAGPAADGTGLDRRAIDERAGAGRDGRGDRPDHHRRVFNIETGTGNYVAGGLLVHNCHMIKNNHAARTMAVRRLARNVTSFVALSGTPITHHPADLWPTLTCLDRHAWPSRERWVARYCTVAPGVDYGEAILGLAPHAEPEFRLALLGQNRRVARADVMDQLPPKVYSVRTVALPAAHRKAYDAFENTMLAELPDGQELSVMDVLVQMTFLSQLACAAADVEVTVEQVDDGYGGLVDKQHTHIELKAPSWKVDALLEVLEERPGEQTLCFSVSAQLARLAGAAAAEAGLRVGYVIGGQSQRERTATIAKFQARELDLVCATTKAGGIGITLSAAGTVVFLQRPYSLVESLQSEDRAEGDLTQTRGTEIVDIVAENTIDTRVRAVLRERAGQLAELVRDPRIVAELLGGATVTKIKRKAVA